MRTQSIGKPRRATPADATALARLLEATELPMAPADVRALFANGQVLVIELEPGVLGAVAQVRLDVSSDGAIHAVLGLLVVHPALGGTGVEEQMATALLALCEECGSVDLDVTPSPTGRRRAS